MIDLNKLNSIKKNPQRLLIYLRDRLGPQSCQFCISRFANFTRTLAFGLLLEKCFLGSPNAFWQKEWFSYSHVQLDLPIINGLLPDYYQGTGHLAIYTH